MKINTIKKLKDNKYKIIINDECITTYDNVILDNNLLYKKEIDINMYNKIIEDTNYYDVYNKVVKYILKKRRSEKEILKYLNKFDLDEDKINKTILKLKELNLINDIEFCRAFINDNVYLSKKGLNKIRIELLEQDIPIDVIEEEMSKIDCDIINQRLEKLIVKKINYNRKYSNNFLKQKILNEMINLGYSKDKILEIIDKNMDNEETIIQKEFDKIYDKLKIKYNGVELKSKLKQKLLSKGFELDKINKLIQEKTEE